MSYFKSNKPKALKDLLEDFIDDYPHRKRLKRGMILSLWPRVVGEAINDQVEDIHFEDDKLVVKVPNQIWRHEIHMKRFSIMAKLNREVNEKIIREMVVRS